MDEKEAGKIRDKLRSEGNFIVQYKIKILLLNLLFKRLRTKFKTRKNNSNP